MSNLSRRTAFVYWYFCSHLFFVSKIQYRWPAFGSTPRVQVQAHSFTERPESKYAMYVLFEGDGGVARLGFLLRFFPTVKRCAYLTCGGTTIWKVLPGQTHPLGLDNLALNFGSARKISTGIEWDGRCDGQESIDNLRMPKCGAHSPVRVITTTLFLIGCSAGKSGRTISKGPHPTRYLHPRCLSFSCQYPVQFYGD